MTAPNEHSAPARRGPVLILGGTSEARALARALVALGWPVTSSLAGRVANPALPPGLVRIGGFSTPGSDGTAGLADYLVQHQITAVVDATHPFAATISANAIAATSQTQTLLIRLERPGWQTHPAAETWTWVDSVAAVMAAAQSARRPFLTTGRQSLAEFLPWSDRAATVRVVDPPSFPLPDRWQLIRSRGPYALDAERELMLRAHTDLLVAKDSGGSLTAAKLDAAASLGIQIVVIARPPRPAADLTTVETVEQALALLKRVRSGI